jgi:PadR family transcriptional regulator
MRKRRKSSTQTLVVLTALLERPRTWQHGYDLAKTTALRSGTLYPILSRLEDRGYLESKWLESQQTGRPPRHVYQLTSLGLVFAREMVNVRESPHLLTLQNRIKA